MANQSIIGLGSDVIVTLTDTQTLTNKTLTGPTLSGNMTGTGSIVLGYGSFTGSVVAGYGNLPNLIPQGQLPTGSIPNLSASYIPQGQLINGSLPTNISVSGSITSSGSLIGAYGSFAGSITANYGIIPNLLPQGVLPSGSLTNALPHGQLPTGSLPNSIVISNDLQVNDGSFSGSVIIVGSLLGNYGSFSTNVAAGSYFGYGGALSGIVASASPSGSNTTIQFNDDGTGSGDTNLTWAKTGSTLRIVGSLVAVTGSFSGSVYGYGGTLSGISASGMTWSEVTGTTQSMAVDNGYIANNAARVVFTLPTTAAIGKLTRVTGKGAGGWSIQQNAGETIYFGIGSTTTGTSGSLQSTHFRDSVELVCVVADTGWNVISSIGNIEIV